MREVLFLLLLLLLLFLLFICSFRPKYQKLTCTLYQMLHHHHHCCHYHYRFKSHRWIDCIKYWLGEFVQTNFTNTRSSLKSIFLKTVYTKKRCLSMKCCFGQRANTMITHRRGKIGSSLNFQGKSFEKKKLHFNPPIIRNYCYGSSLNSGSFRFVCCPFVLAPFSLWSILPIFHALKIEPSKGEF